MKPVRELALYLLVACAHEAHPREVTIAPPPPPASVAIPSEPAPERVETKAPDVVRKGRVMVDGGLPQEIVERVVIEHFGQLRGCYEAVRVIRFPNLEARVDLSFVIDAMGAVSRTEIRNMPLVELGTCVREVITRASFPKPERGVVRVVFPIIFGPE